MPIEKIVPPTDGSISLGEAAFRAIRDAILSNQVLIGEHLREESLAQQLGMSRTPVREALSRLHSEGLLEEAKPRGFVVASVTATDVFHVYAVREVLEGFCLRIAASRITAHQLFQLSTIMEQMERCIDDAASYSRLNRRFHAIIFEATDNPVLEKIMDDLTATIERFPVSAYAVDGRAREALEEHRRILDALERRDPDAAEAAIREHLKIGLEARIAALRRHALDGI